MITPSASFRRRAFTLIELLVVISILAILMGLLFPAVTGAMENAKKTQARNDATQIATALTAYFTEYGRFPTDAGNNQNTMDILSGKNVNTENPREMVFLEIPRAKADANGRIEGAGAYMDPWKREYFIVVDTDYDNKVDAPTGNSESGEVQKSVAVWSKGNPKNQKDFQNASKWLKSYE